eukprot:1156328-Pelagomonas_calceolata.AAC.15
MQRRMPLSLLCLTHASFIALQRRMWMRALRNGRSRPHQEAMQVGIIMASAAGRDSDGRCCRMMDTDLLWPVRQVGNNSGCGAVGMALSWAWLGLA